MARRILTKPCPCGLHKSPAGCATVQRNLARRLSDPLPACACGCGRQVKTRWRTKGKPAKYFSVACIPLQVRVEAGRKGRKAFIVTSRLKLFRGELKRLQALERITAQELVATFAAIGARMYDNGYSCCETKWLRRTRRTGKAA